MKRKLSFLLLYSTLVLFGGLGTLVLLFGEKEPHASLTENRMLAGFPELSLQAIRNGRFMSGLEDFLSDNIPERDTLVQGAGAVMDLLSLRSKTADEETDELAAQLASFAQEGAENIEPFESEPEPEATFKPEVMDTDTPAPEATPVPGESPQFSPEPSAVPEATAASRKDLSEIRACTFTLTMKNGSTQTVYTFPKENIQRAVRVLNAYRALLPADGHVFFAQPPFSGIGFKLQNGTCIGWGSDLEDTINEFSDDGVYMVSVEKVLEQPLLDKEYLYFNTDHHWTPRAASYVANAILKTMGIDPRPYDSYTFHTFRDFYGSTTVNNPQIRATRKPDTLEVLILTTPVKGYQVLWNGAERNAPLIYENNHTYMAFLGGTKGPWRRFETGVDSGRNCLVIGDSFSTCFVPFLAPYYETILVTDVRDGYYDRPHARWTISQYMQQHGVDDVYIVLSTSSSINTAGMFEKLLRYL